MTKSKLAMQRMACITLAAVLSLGTVGCATTGGGMGGSSSADASLSPAEQKLRADSERFDNTVIGGVIKGAATGAVLGGLWRAATGGDRHEIARAAVGGAVIGGALGGIDGYRTAKLQEAKMNEVAALQAMAQDVKTDNDRLQAFLDSSSTVLAEGKQRLAAVRGDVDAKRMTAAQAEAARKREEQNIAQMQATLKKAKDTQTQYAQTSATFQGSAANKRNLDAEIARMDRQISTLERNINDYNRALAVSKA